MKTITIGDVAKYAGVSKSTVSQYLNGRYDYMGVNTKERIRSAIDYLEYSPNSIARSLISKKTKTIGVIVANILHEFSTKITRAIEDVSHELGYHIIICNADEDPAKEKYYINMLLAKQVDGIIAFPTGGNTRLYQSVLDKGVSVVFIDRTIDQLEISTVLLDNKEASELLVEDLVHEGYSKIALITTFPNTITPRKERIDGYIKSLGKYGLTTNDSYICTVPIDSIEQTLDKLLDLSKQPEAVIATNDLTLMEILKYVNKHKIKIPEDIAVSGIDDIYFARFFNPPLTTVAQPAFEMGKKAAELVIQKVESDNMDAKHVYRFKPELKKRDSTKRRKFK